MNERCPESEPSHDWSRGSGAGSGGKLVPVTLQSDDERVGVDEADGQGVDPCPAEQGVDARFQVAGRLDRDLHQAFGGAVDQPAPAPALVHAYRAADPGPGSLDRTDGDTRYVQLEGAHPDPDLVGVNLHARDARARAE